MYSSQRHLEALSMQHFERGYAGDFRPQVRSSCKEPSSPTPTIGAGMAEAIIADLSARRSFAMADQEVCDYSLHDFTHEVATAQAQNRPLAAGLWWSLMGGRRQCYREHAGRARPWRWPGRRLTL